MKLILSILLAGVVNAQPLQFDAVTVKASASGNPYQWNIGRPPGRFTATNASLRSLLLNAYALKDYLLVTPGWMEGERFDVQAKASEHATKSQIDVMAQNLLRERFKMELHREQREFPAYVLVRVKPGPRPKESAPGTEPPPEPTGPPDMTRPLTMPAKDSDGFPILKGSARWASTSSDGTTKVFAKGMTMGELAKMLSTQLQREVTDKTGLTGKFDFRLEYAADGTMRPPVPMPVIPGPPRETTEVSGQPIFRALQDQLGLKLESGKAPLEVLVIDKAEKVPVEN